MKKTRKAILAVMFAVMALGALPAQARLGWTLAECEAKYGPAKILPTETRAVKEAQMEAEFSYEGWMIRVAWYEGSNQAQWIRYTVNGSRMTDAQLTGVLNANADGLKWTERLVNGNHPATAAVALLSGGTLGVVYYESSDGAVTTPFSKMAFNSVALKSAWLKAWDDRNKAIEQEKKTRVPDL